MSWKIEHPCPQCGAPVEMEETDRILKCEFCRTRLYICPKDSFQFFLAPPQPRTELFFLPYWRFKGMAFSCDELQVSGKIADSNILAMKMAELPLSLGVRPQVLKLRYVVPDVPGRFLKPQLPFRTTSGCGGSSNGPGHVADMFIGEIKSLIYSPVYVAGGWLYDAILDRKICQAQEQALAGPDGENTLQPEDQIFFLPTLCPQCGFDLDGEKDSLVLLCPNCSTAWQARNFAFESVPFAFIAPSGGDKPDVYLPFWRIAADVSGLQIKSYADLVRLANLPRVVLSEWEKEAAHFAVPAFKIYPGLFLRLAKTMTFLQKEVEDRAEVHKTNLYPVTLPLNDALEALRVFIASIARPQKNVIPHLNAMSFSLTDFRLVFVPFTLRGEELIQNQIGISIEKAALSWGKLL
ncbi:MAG: hypothetical protein ACP5IL_00075 [Syntrophobacteraceae bacterium]